MVAVDAQKEDAIKRLVNQNAERIFVVSHDAINLDAVDNCTCIEKKSKYIFYVFTSNQGKNEIYPIILIN